MDNFTIAVLAGAAAVIAGFLLMMIFDKKKSNSNTPTNAPTKPAGK